MSRSSLGGSDGGGGGSFSNSQNSSSYFDMNGEDVTSHVRYRRGGTGCSYEYFHWLVHRLMTPNKFAHPFTRSLTHPLTHSLTHSLTRPLLLLHTSAVEKRFAIPRRCLKLGPTGLGRTFTF